MAAVFAFLNAAAAALRMIGHDEPQCRLACLVTRVGGPVGVQVPK